jgi:TPR repeat protein
MSKQWAAFLFFVLFSVATNADEWSGPDAVLKAAQFGNPEAQLEMGILYEYGFFMKENRAPALAWYILSANQGNRQAAQRRDVLQQKMTPAGIEQARKMAPTLLSAEAPAPMSPPAAAPETKPAPHPETTPEPIGAPVAKPVPAAPTAVEPVLSEKSKEQREAAAKALTETLSPPEEEDQGSELEDASLPRSAPAAP